MYNDDELWDNLMESLFNDEEYLEEGLFDKFKEKRAKKKAEKEERRNQEKLRNLVVINENEFSKYEKEFNEMVKFMTNLLKKEVPGCRFASQNIKHSSQDLGGHIINRFSIGLFDLDDDNFKKFISKSKNPELKVAENTWDCVDELIQDTFDRIGNPLSKKGYDYDENRVYSKEKDGKGYLFIDLGDEATFSVYMYMDIAVKKESVEESYDFVIDDYLEEGLFDRIKEKRAEKKARKEEEKERRRQKEEEEKAARKAKNDERKARQATEYLNKFVMYKASEEESGPKKDLADLANDIKAILKKEIPGCTFVGNKAKHNTTRLDKGCMLHTYTLIIFRMDEENKKRFVKNTKSGSLKAQDTARRTADTIQKFGRVANMMTGNYGYNSTDMLKGSVDMLTSDIDKLVDRDFIKRIREPIIEMGFTGKRNAFVKEKNGMEYLGVKIESGTFEYEISVKVKYIVKPNDYVEESYEPVEELFGLFKKKKEQPNVPNKEYDGNKIRSDIKNIWQDIRRIINSDPDIKKFVDNGIDMYSLNDIYDLTDKNASVYNSKDDEFQMVWIDLWDYKGGNPRLLMNESEDGWHPVNHGVEKLRNKIKEMLKKYPDFILLDDGGDWDTSSINIGLKSE